QAVARHCPRGRCARGGWKRDSVARRRHSVTLVWLRLRRDAGADARANHVCASAGAGTDTYPQERKSWLAATRCQIAGLGNLREWETNWNLMRRRFHTAYPRCEAFGTPQLYH